MAECPTCKKWELCEKNCKPRHLCTKEDKGLFVEVNPLKIQSFLFKVLIFKLKKKKVRYLQLSDIDIPIQVNERRLLTLIRELEEEKEKSIKEEMIVRKQTELEVNTYQNAAKEAIANATAMSKFVMDQAEVNYSREIENTHNIGLKNLFDGLGFSDNKLKSSMNYMRTLQDHEKIKYSIDFNTLIASNK